MTYAGFSAGAIYGVGFVLRDPGRFPMVMMSEGGYAQLTDASFARTFARGGGRRVLLGCSTGGGCLSKFNEAAASLRSSAVQARVNDAGRIAHNLNGDVVRSLHRDWPWLVAGQEGWENYDPLENHGTGLPSVTKPNGLADRRSQTHTAKRNAHLQ